NVGPSSPDFLVSAELGVWIKFRPGAASDSAVPYSGPIPLANTALVQARVFDGAQWSPLNQALFSVGAVEENLRITEVMYNPADPPPGSPYGNDDFEFIELKNGGPALDLSNVALTDGVAFSFPAPFILGAGQHAVIVSNRQAFESRYGTGVPVVGEYTGSLNNAGENVRLEKRLPGSEAPPKPIVEFEYDDGRGWPLAADGGGHSLTPLERALDGAPTGSLDYGGNWRASAYIHGSPGADDPDPPADVVVNEFAAHTDYNVPPHDSNDWIELKNVAQSAMTMNGWHLSDSISKPEKWAIPDGTVIPAGGRIVFDEVHDFHNPITQGFGLSKYGEQVILSYLPGTGLDRIVDAVRFEGQEGGTTLGRHPDGTLVASTGGAYWFAMPPSPGQVNAPPLRTPVLHEIMYHPPDGSAAASEYVEIFYPAGTGDGDGDSLELWNAQGTWRLAGGLEFAFPPDASIEPGRHLLVVPFDPAQPGALSAFQAAYGIDEIAVPVVGPYSRNLSNRGERVALEKPEAADLPEDPISWVIVDEVIYFHQSPFPTAADGKGASLQRVSPDRSGRDPSNWTAAAPSPGQAASSLPLVVNLPAVDVSTDSAALRGELVSTGGRAVTVRIHWGASDGGAQTAAWANTREIGSLSRPGTFSIRVTGLLSATTHYFRCRAENAAGVDWADASESFRTNSVLPSPTPTPAEGPIRDLIASFYQLVLGRPPEAGAVDAWHYGYFDYAVSFQIDVRFIPREMARLFFLSDEYAARNRSNAEFITDCYRAFLNRDPSDLELSNWVSGVWNRSEVMTIFSESDEFAGRIEAMYPGFNGDSTRNFVTFMYIGLLDRLVDQNGLEYAAGLFDAAFASGGVEAVRAQAKQMAREVIVSEEFRGKQPTTADYVVRFYRAFLGRFPNDSEAAFWTGELNSGRQTTDTLIDLFGDSVEFTGKLRTYFGNQ
ncbi:MAG TPA: DUF4214 domain-containing protein, partial [Sumerlaeia bacterium]|nr:DUF4214 domain-containing protein [Sumerlaeia bacterium]